MRRLAALVLICLAVAAPAAAGPGGKITVVKQPPPKTDAATGLRGALPAGGAVQSKMPDGATIPPALAQAWSAPVPQAGGTDAMQCRSGCAQTYYFCAAGGDEDCAGRWAQCSASCTASATYQPYQPAF